MQRANEQLFSAVGLRTGGGEFSIGERAKIASTSISPMRGQKRVINELPKAEADALTDKAKSFQSFREFVLQCLEVKGLDMSRSGRPETASQEAADAARRSGA